MSGHQDIELPKEQIPLKKTFEMKGDRDLFVRAKIENGFVEILDGQESNILKSFAEANALVYIPSNAGKIEKGIRVETHRIIF
jgi:molybdopterin molybdotransferase